MSVNNLETHYALRNGSRQAAEDHQVHVPAAGRRPPQGTVALESKAPAEKEKLNGANVYCMSCKSEVNKGEHLGISCQSGHYICAGACCGTYVSVVLGDPNLVPLKCPTCKAGIVSQTFERQLTADQNALYLNYVAMKEISDEEQVVSCPHCSYFEVWNAHNKGETFVYCKNTKCAKASCVHCHLDLVQPEGGGYEDEEMKAEVQDKCDFRSHMRCAELAADKVLIEEAIAKGNGMDCPKCGVTGRKDDECTHIICESCLEEFCYVCGVAETKLDKQNPRGPINSHNVDWETNPRRCPMYLTQIGEIDIRWPGEAKDDAECVAMFSRFRTISLLRTAVRGMGVRRFRELCNHFDSINNCGFTETQILTGDITVINREQRQF